MQHNAFISNMLQIVGKKKASWNSAHALGSLKRRDPDFPTQFAGSDLSIMIQPHQRLKIENLASSVKTANLQLTSTECSDYTEGDLCIKQGCPKQPSACYYS